MPTATIERGQVYIPEQTAGQRVENFMKVHLAPFGNLLPENLRVLQRSAHSIRSNYAIQLNGRSIEAAIGISGSEVSATLTVKSRRSKVQVSGRISSDKWHFLDARFYENPNIPVFINGQEALLRAPPLNLELLYRWDLKISIEELDRLKQVLTRRKKLNPLISNKYCFFRYFGL